MEIKQGSECDIFNKMRDFTSFLKTWGFRNVHCSNLIREKSYLG